MAVFRSLRELEAFVRALPIPDERRIVVGDELTGHVMERIAHGACEAEALANLGDPALLESLLAPAEWRFRPSNRVVMLWATGVGAAIWLGEMAGASLYGRVPPIVAATANLAIAGAIVALALPRWARRAAYEARISLAIGSWLFAALPAMFLDDLFQAPPLGEVGVMAITLWIVPVFVLIGCRIDRAYPVDERTRSRLELRLF